MSTSSKTINNVEAVDSYISQHKSYAHRWKRLTAPLAVLIATASVLLFQSRRSEEPACRPPLPNLILETEPDVSNYNAINKAIKDVDAELSSFFDKGGIDSISVAVVTPIGSIYEGFWGTLRANETESMVQESVNRDTIYRLASISKVFTTMEAYILRDRLHLNLDESLYHILPELKEKQSNPKALTMRQLMTHMSGLGRDWPPGDAKGSWPESRGGAGPAWYNGLNFPTREEFLSSIAVNRLVAQPYTLPSYSNTGFSLLGLANVAWNQAKEGEDAPSTHAELLSRDIFVPLELNSSFFVLTEETKSRIAVASVFPEETDLVMDDATNAAGGQMSSLADLIKVMQTLLDVRSTNGFLDPSTIREWLRPIHTWWDDYSEVGHVWEIYKFKDTFGRQSRMYQKVGELYGHHTIFTLNPTNSFGVIALTTGPSSQTFALNNIIFPRFQRAFDMINLSIVKRMLAGEWYSYCCLINIKVEAGSLIVSKYNINGSDVLTTIRPDGISSPAQLVPTSDTEYRLSVFEIGVGCFNQWISMDFFGYIDGYSTNILRLVQNGTDIGLEIPAIKSTLYRK